MRLVAGGAAALLDAFETIVLPRRVHRRIRLTPFFIAWTWLAWSAPIRRTGGRGHDLYLSFYGPLSLILLVGIWAAALVLGFGFLQWGVGSNLVGPEGRAGLGATIYMSGTTFFTLGLGDVVPHGPAGRVITIVESGSGFAFLALVIGYLPVLYQAFSRREVSISLLDARAGSPPSAVEMLRRCRMDAEAGELRRLFQEWERWAAELLESHLSFPVLGYYRSQHERQSWVAAVTMVLDACALVMAGMNGSAVPAARLTFAIARHAAVDLSQIFGLRPETSLIERLPADRAQLRSLLDEAGIELTPAAETRLAELRALYEPYVAALAAYLLMPLPAWLPAAAPDDWQTTAFERG
jgi:hypothetical protein